ncbi:hypothetical protein [Rhizobium sp. Leaf386]|uniref:hypothetical protein n=1 Tax=Rhizobium sp. Leaf386 TaxID=1736359 RepID=UPI0007157FD1|nr:hypothetical protein [Rhizobium sp. Leaf386]KQS89826.1 hypothetical protein ASG50_27905 [Rhizobium sp. Leaf386]
MTMALYAWTIRVPGRKPIERVSAIDELHQTLTVLDLPGAPSPLGITADADGIVPDTGKFRHVDVEDGFDWSVTWTKVV